MTWDERDHPRDRRGRFIEKADWASVVSDLAGGILGPQGEFDSPVMYRAFPSSLVPGLVPGHDPHDAEMQVREAEENWGGLGRWWWLPGEIQDVGFYGGVEGTLLAGVRVRSGQTPFRTPSGHSGQFASEPVEMAVVSLQVWEDGWRPIPVPSGLITRSHTPYED